MIPSILNIDNIIEGICDGKILLTDLFSSDQTYNYVLYLYSFSRYLKMPIKY